MRVVARYLGAAALAAVVGGLAGCANNAAPPRPHMERTGAAPCLLPPISKPNPGIENGGLTGPAVQSLHGGAALQAFSLDRGAFAMIPPPTGTSPAVSLEQAECEALASSGSNGGSFVEAAGSTGAAVGYGMVTIASGVPEEPVGEQRSFGAGSPVLTLPGPSPYQGRLAWALVFEQFLEAACPAQTSAAASGPTIPPAQVGYHYVIFLVDATTGRDAVVYNEAQPSPCGGASLTKPFLHVPYEESSVPWTLISRDKNGYSAQIRAQVPRCDSYDNPVNVVRGTDMVAVMAYGIVGATCPTVPVSIRLQAEDVFSDLPPELVHAPVGLDAGGVGMSSVPTARPHEGRLVNVGSEQNGHTITVRVGDVVAVLPVGGENPAKPYEIDSTDPSVLGLLGIPGAGLPEFRAWKAGSSTLRVPLAQWAVEVVVDPR